jgi:hypothetical protein
MTENRDELVRRVADSREVLNGIQQLRNGNWSERLLVETILEAARSLTDGGQEHPNSDVCGFDRQASLNEDRYVCLCGWRDKASPEQSGFVRVPVEFIDGAISLLDKALGDTDITHLETDEEIKEHAPLQWLCSQLSELLAAAKEKQ